MQSFLASQMTSPNGWKGSFEELHAQAYKILAITRQKLHSLNQFQYSIRYHDEIDSNVKDDEDFLKREINSMIGELDKHCDHLGILAAKQFSEGNRRVNNKYKVDQFKSDIRCIKSSYASLQAWADKKEQEVNNRKSLLNTRFTTNAESAMKVLKVKDTNDSTSILIDRALAQNESLKFSNREVDNMLNQGSQMLESLQNQRSIIKGFQRKVMDITSTLNLSTTVLRLIERRGEGDKWVLICGVITTIIVMLIVIHLLA